MDAVDQALADAASEELDEEELKGYSDCDDEEEDKVFFKQSDLLYQPKSDQRNWLRKHGKSKYIDFDE